VPILSVDGKPLAYGTPGALTRQLQAAYDAVVRGQQARYRHWLTPVYG